MSDTTAIRTSATKPEDPTFVDYRPLFQPNPVLDEFRKYLVTHRVFTECEREILRRVASPGGANILSVVGPTGAGKTQLLNEVVGVLLNAPEPQSLPSSKTADLVRPYLPVVYVKAPTGLTFQSRFRSLLIEILKQVNKVLTDTGMVRAVNTVDKRRCQSLQRVSIPRLEELARTGLRERRTRAVLIDEGQHLAMSADAEDWLMVAESLKVLGSFSGTLIVLFGTFEILCLPDLSGQLGRRTKSIHMRRYLWNVPADQAEFTCIVKTMAQVWPQVLPEKLLLDNLPLVYAGCVGCIGTLFDWLHDAMVQARGKTVTMDVLLECAFPETRLRKFDWEAQQCERAFKREKGGLSNFAEEICGSTTSVESRSAQSEDTREHTPKGRRGRVRRKPTFDPYQPVFGGTA